MNYEYFGEHLVNTSVNTFLREMHTLNTLQAFNSLINKNAHSHRYVLRKLSKVFINRNKVFMEVCINYSLNYEMVVKK